MVWAVSASVVVAVEVEERPATVVVGVDCGGWRVREVREKEKEKERREINFWGPHLCVLLETLRFGG